MKKIVSLILALVMCLSLCACGGSKSPSKNDINKDLQEALIAKNPYAELKSAEVEKSLAKDDHYEITYNVKAETRYSDWSYQVTLNYTNYDQGWKLDSANWVSEEYEQTRFPSADVLESIVNNGEDQYAVWYLDDIVPVQNGEIDYSDMEETGLLQITWATEYDYLHAIQTEYTKIYWSYDATSDSWSIAEYKKGYVRDVSTKYAVKQGVDFCRAWTSFEITEWSEEKMTVKIDGGTYPCVRTDSWEGGYKYASGDGNGLKVYFNFNENATYITYEAPFLKADVYVVTFD